MLLFILGTFLDMAATILISTLRDWWYLGGASDTNDLAVLWGFDCHFFLGGVCLRFFTVTAKIDGKIVKISTFCRKTSQMTSIT